ncbi:MAG: F0F1 ATP synthase subunit A [Bacteroidota bacterium]
MLRFFLSTIYILAFAFVGSAQHDHDDHSHGDGHHAAVICGEEAHHDFNAGDNAIHHIADANVYSIGPIQIPLPVILYAPDKGWDFFMASKFHADFVGHGDGHVAYNGYVLDGGSVKRVVDAGFPQEGEVKISGIIHKKVDVDGKEKEVAMVCYKEQLYKTDSKSTADAGLFGGGITSFYDFSITKNVTSMALVLLFLSWIFLAVAKAAKKNEGKAPTGLQNFMEPFVSFIQDEVAIPFLGEKYEKFLPFLLSIFFFILGLNLFGQIPFFGGSNVTGNLAVTAVLAIITFLITNINGNRDYWHHLFTAPGTPLFVKVILVPVELLGLFIKPVTLMLRLFANITAGHMVILIFVSFIFIFGKSGESIPGAAGGVVGAGLLTLFMMAIELVVAFVQAFVFTILTASYIGAATEEHHHEEHAH